MDQVSLCLEEVAKDGHRHPESQHSEVGDRGYQPSSLSHIEQDLHHLSEEEKRDFPLSSWAFEQQSRGCEQCSYRESNIPIHFVLNPSDITEYNGYDTSAGACKEQ